MDTKIKMLFPGQQADEEVCLVLREHWISLASKIFVWLIFALLYFGVDYLHVYYLPGQIPTAYLDLVGLFKVIYLMFLLLGGFIVLVMYYLNVYIITSRRIVNIEQKSVLQHRISELHLSQTQDVTAEIHGFLENVFNFGDVYIQTAAETERFLFHNVPNPSKVTKVVLDLYEKLPDEYKNHTGLNQPKKPL